MSTATGLPPNVSVYLEALRAELADLAPEEREDVLSEVEPSLLEAAADGDEPIAARLGAPADFAADLRASAGLPPAPHGRSSPASTGRCSTPCSRASAAPSGPRSCWRSRSPARSPSACAPGAPRERRGEPRSC
jgi:hypothetical protein